MQNKLLAIITALSVLLTGCGNDDGKGTEQKQVLNLMDVDEITSLDTIHSIDSASSNATNNAMEGLYMPNEKGEFIPAVAETHTVSEDRTVYTFSLRNDARWSNGDAVRAEDFVFAFKKALNPSNGSQYAYMMYDIVNAEAIQKGEKDINTLGVKAIDSHTLEITLKQPVPYFIKLLSVPIFFPQSKSFVEKQGDKYGVYADTTLYNGPFIVSELSPGKGFKMVKNNEYYDKDKVKIDEINVKIVKDTSTAVNLYESNQVDQIPVSAEFVDKYKKQKDFHTTSIPMMSFIRMNQRNPLLKNKEIREAISQSIEKQGITDTILQNGSTPSDLLVPKQLISMPNGEDFRNEKSVYASVDKKKANELFENGKKQVKVAQVKLNLLVSDKESDKKIAEYIKEQLESNLTGLRIHIQILPKKQMLAALAMGEYDLSLNSWGADYPDPTTYLDLFRSDSQLNYMQYASKEYDGYLHAAKEALLNGHLAERMENLKMAEQVLVKDVAIIPLYQAGYVYVENSKVKDIAVRPFVGYFHYKYASKK